MMERNDGYLDQTNRSTARRPDPVLPLMSGPTEVDRAQPMAAAAPRAPAKSGLVGSRWE